MKALLLGFFGVFAAVIAIGFLAMNPEIFWIILVVLAGAFLFGIYNGRKQASLRDSNRIQRQNVALNRRDQISEDDIVHQHQPNGRPFQNRDKPAAATNPTEQMAGPDPEIQEAASMYYDRDTDFDDEA